MKPNVVFVLTDQWRQQAFGYTGDPNVKTPHVDALAAESINCINTVSVCPVCTPHRASLLTGRYPSSTGMFMNDLYLPKEEYCMAEMFQNGGYNTAYIGKWHLDGQGRDSYIPPERRQGFDYWKVLECTHEYNESYYYDGNDPVMKKWDGYDAYAQTRDAQAYIRNHAGEDKPFLLFLGYGGPHFPHHNAPDSLKALYPPESIELRPNVTEQWAESARKELQGYYAHCTAIDRCLGDLVQTLEEAGLKENTILVFTSDHGDMFGSQGCRPYMKQVPWDESVRVPFLLRYPKIHSGGQTVTTPLNTPEILPTLLSLAGLSVPETIEGEDLSRLLRGEGEEPDRPALFMMMAPIGNVTKDLRPYRGVRTARYTYVRSSEGPWLLYDNREDPYQMENLVNRPDTAELQASLERALCRHLQRNKDSVMTKEEAVAKWGYHVSESGEIPYNGDFLSQSPGRDKGVPCQRK